MNRTELRPERARKRRAARAAILFALALAASAGSAAAIKRRAFVTSASGTGNLSTWPGATGATALERADSICRLLAQTASPAPLPNAATYRAWLSTSTTDAFCHVQGASGKKSTDCGGAALPGGGPRYRVDGVSPFTVYCISNVITNFWDGFEITGDASRWSDDFP